MKGILIMSAVLTPVQKKHYERADLMQQADVIATGLIKDYALADYTDDIKRSAHWAVNAVCNRLWVKNGGKEPDIDEGLASIILDEVYADIDNRCKTLAPKEQEVEIELD